MNSPLHTRWLHCLVILLCAGVSRNAAQTAADGSVPIRIWANAQSSSGAGGYYTAYDSSLVGSYTPYDTPLYYSWQGGYFLMDFYGFGPMPQFNMYYPYIYVYETQWQAQYAARLEISGSFVSGNAFASGTTSVANQAFSAAIPGTVRVALGKSYTINMAGSFVASGALNVAVPPQCRVILNGVERNRCGLAGTITLAVVSTDPRPHGAAGFASSLAADRVEWSIPLGSLRNGDDAGALTLINPGTGVDWNALFTPAGLNCEPTSDEVLVYRVGNMIRQVIANQVAIDVVVPTGATTSYEIRCYSSQQLQTATPPCTFNGQPFVTYTVKKSDDAGDSATALKIVRDFRNITDLNATTHPVARTETTKLVRTGPTPTFTWTRHDWHTGTGAVNETVASISTAGPTRTEQIALRNAGNPSAVALTATRTYNTFSFGESLATEVVGTTDSRTVNFGYYSDANQPGSLGYVESVRLTGGGWESYDYHDTNQAMSYQGGRIKYRYRPWGATATDTPQHTSTEGEVVYYEYGLDSFGFSTRPTLIRTTINGTETAKTTFSYSSTDPNAQVTTTRTDYASATSSLVTTTTAYSEGWSDAFFRGKPITITRPDGVRMSYSYEKGSWNGTTFVANGIPSTASRISVATLQSNNTPLDRVSTKQVTIRDSRALVARTELYVSNGGAWEIMSWTNFTYNAAGLPVGRTSSNGATYSATWNGNVKVNETDEKGVVTTYEPDAAGRVLTATRAGASAGGASIAELTTLFTYDAANHVTEQRVGPTGGEYLFTTNAYDDAGRLTSEATPGIGATTHSYNVSARRHTITRPDGSTIRETQNLDGTPASRTGTGVVSQYSAYGVESDGRRWTRTDIADRGSLRWSKTWTDWLGRKTLTRRPAFGATIVNYEAQVLDETNEYLVSTGQRTKSTKPGFAPTLYGYNALSQLVRAGLDIDASTTLGPSSTDRINDSSEMFENFDGGWWASKAESRYPYEGASAGTAVQTAKTSKRLSGLGDVTADGQLQEETRSWDIFGNETRRTVRVSAPNKLTTITTSRMNGTTAVLTEVEKSLNGFPISQQSSEGLTTTIGYDALLRQSTATDPRTGTTTTTYHPNTSLKKETTDPAGKRLSWTDYDTAGRPIFTKDALNYTTRTAYTPRGEVAQTWGTATYPVTYEYNEYGERTKMRTYQDPGDTALADTTSFPTLGNGNETAWEFDAATGLLKKKYDAKARFVEYDYDSAGRLWHRYWARTLPNSSTRVTTTYTYNTATGEQTAITYNDGTPGLAYTYNRLGQNTNVVQSYAGSSIQTLLDYCLCGKLSVEYFDGTFFGGRNLTHLTNGTADGFKGRSIGYALTVASTVEQSTTYGYESGTGRFSTLATQAGGQSAFTHTFNYAYATNSNLVSALSVDTNHPFTITRGFESNRDVLTTIEAKWSTTSRTKYAYTYDDRRQRANVVQSGDVFADYGGPSSGAIHQNFAYNGRGELIQAATWLGDLAAGEPDTSFMSARKHEFAYDGIGNRRWSNTGGVTGTRDNYAVNELNQYVARENNTLPVGGTVADDSSIKVVAGADALVAAGRHGRHWGDNALVNNLNGPYLGSFKIFAAKPNGGGSTDLLKTVDRTVLASPAWQAFAYDEDGNILSDGVWKYTWDGENRLIAIETMPEAIGPIPSAEARRLEFKYDHLGRRIEKLVRAGWNGSTYSTTPTLQRRYLYDGWNVVAEYSVSSGPVLTLVRSYTWGLDIVHTLEKSGGVGALLQIADHTVNQAHLAAYDGNGNVAALFNASSTGGGTSVAAYEYSPYGELLRCEGTYAKENTFRFSTKCADDETGLVYYGRRYYSPSAGRFIGRDTKGEKGGKHLYAFAANDPNNRWDYLGMSPSGAPKDGGDVYTEISVEDGKTYLLTWYAQGDGTEGNEFYWNDEPDEVEELPAVPMDPFNVTANRVSVPGIQPLPAGFRIPTINIPGGLAALISQMENQKKIDCANSLKETQLQLRQSETVRTYLQDQMAVQLHGVLIASAQEFLMGAAEAFGAGKLIGGLAEAGVKYAGGRVTEWAALNGQIMSDYAAVTNRYIATEFGATAVDSIAEFAAEKGLTAVTIAVVSKYWDQFQDSFRHGASTLALAQTVTDKLQSDFNKLQGQIRSGQDWYNKNCK